MPYDPEYLAYFERWNARDFYGCHEVLEKRWLLLPGGDRKRVYYKGLIQAAAAFHLMSRKRYAGARRLLESAVRYLSEFPAVYEGFALKPFRQLLKAWRKRMDHAGTETGVVGRVPTLELRPPGARSRKRASRFTAPLVALGCFLASAVMAFGEDPAPLAPETKAKLRLLDRAVQYYELAQSARAANATARAEKLYRRALKIHRDFREAQEALADLYASQGRADKAAAQRRSADRLKGKPSALEEHARLAAAAPGFVREPVNVAQEERLEAFFNTLFRILLALSLVFMALGCATWLGKRRRLLHPSQRTSLFLAPFPDDQEVLIPIPAPLWIGTLALPFGAFYEVLRALDIGMSLERVFMTVTGGTLLALVCQILFFSGADIAPLYVRRRR